MTNHKASTPARWQEEENFNHREVNMRPIRSALFFSFIFVLFFAATARASISFTETLLDVSGADDFGARISGNNIVFTSNRNGDFGIYTFNPNHFPIPLADGLGNQSQPDIDGNRVVYVDDSGVVYPWRNKDIYYMADFTTFTSAPVTSFGSQETNPRISGNTIVYESNRNGNLDLFRIDLLGWFEAQLDVGAGLQWQPAISGNTVVWISSGPTVGNQVVYAPVGSTPTVIGTTVLSGFASPSISGNLIAYIRGTDIHIYDISTGANTAITNDIHSQLNPIVSGTNVLYSDDRNGNFDIFLYDTIDGQTYQLTSDPLDQMLTDVDGNVAVFEDTRFSLFGLRDVWRLDFTINHAPVANAGRDLAVTQGTATDPDNNAITSWTWTIASAPAGSAAALTGANSPTPHSRPTWRARTSSLSW